MLDHGQAGPAGDALHEGLGELARPLAGKRDRLHDHFGVGQLAGVFGGQPDRSIAVVGVWFRCCQMT